MSRYTIFCFAIYDFWCSFEIQLLQSVIVCNELAPVSRTAAQFNSFEVLCSGHAPFMKVLSLGNVDLAIWHTCSIVQALFF